MQFPHWTWSYKASLACSGQRFKYLYTTPSFGYHRAILIELKKSRVAWQPYQKAVRKIARKFTNQRVIFLTSQENVSFCAMFVMRTHTTENSSELRICSSSWSERWMVDPACWAWPLHPLFELNGERYLIEHAGMRSLARNLTRFLTSRVFGAMGTQIVKCRRFWQWEWTSCVIH